MRRRNRDRGFTLIELLIVITIILIISVVAIVNYKKAQMHANEMSAVRSVQTIYGAEVLYSSNHPDLGYSLDLASLGGSTQGGGEQDIDANLASGRKSGYTFTYTPGEKVNGAIRSFTVTGVPDQVGTTGQWRLYIDEGGTVHYSASGPADASSPTL